MYFPAIPYSTSLSNRTTLALWVLTNTQSLTSPHPSLSLQYSVIKTPLYFKPGDPATQKPGPCPLGQMSNLPEQDVANSDGRLLGAVWANGKVWITLASSYDDGNQTSATVAALSPAWGTLTTGKQCSNFKAKLGPFKQIGVEGQHLLYPSVNFNRFGKGVMAMALSGPDYYPTAAYTTIDSKGSIGTEVLIAALGVAPIDDFEAYHPPGNNRYGDYQIVSVDEKGQIWAAVEYIGAGTRTLAGNWQTFIFKAKALGTT